MKSHNNFYFYLFLTAIIFISGCAPDYIYRNDYHECISTLENTCVEHNTNL